LYILLKLIYLMRQYTQPKIYFNSIRSFCYFNYNGKRIRVYNGKTINKDIHPNKTKNNKKKLKLLNNLKKELEKKLKNNWSPNSKDVVEQLTNNKYTQSIFMERINLECFEHPRSGSIHVANEIANLIKKKESKNEKCVLGLATGSSPIGIYRELIRMYKEEKLSFKNVISFNLDEYLNMNPNSIHSYNRFMYDNLFNHIDILKKNIHIPKGNISGPEIEKHCIKFEKKIAIEGGIDLQLLGIGRNGHIGFNEPGSLTSSVTRKVNIEYKTRFDAAEEFGGIEKVPKEAISMGISTILKSKKIILVAWGENKGKIIKKAVEETIIDTVPASNLQNHPNTKFFLDLQSASYLNRIVCPWVYKDINQAPKKIVSTTIMKWDNIAIKKAVIWLAFKLKKPILFLTDKDYTEHGMNKIFDIYNTAYETNIKVFNMLQHTITGWPGGKPKVDDSQRPERAYPLKKRIIIFSPHPDDDVISMGGTFDRLIQQGHDVHVAYQTSGNIAVSNENILEITELIKRLSKNLSSKELNELLNLKIINESTKQKQVQWSNNFHNNIEAMTNKKENLTEHKILNKIKGLIRNSEAFQACMHLKLKNENKIYFLNLPFYQTGEIKKNDISYKDINIVKNIIDKIKPHQIFAAGDLGDPHGTHRLCLRTIYNAIDKLKRKRYIKDMYVWLYRGAWKEWKISDIDMAVPLSPDQILKKRKAIFKHKSQKDGAIYPGDDIREFWQRAEDRNKKSAQDYTDLGFAKYAAIEGFKRYCF
jgi:glucosamine-6-phosphate deaminase